MINTFLISRVYLNSGIIKPSTVIYGKTNYKERSLLMKIQEIFYCSNTSYSTSDHFC